MNCKRVQRHLSAFRAGQLSPRRACRLAAHLENCPACRAERDQLQRLDAVLGRWTVADEPRPGFEQRVWNRIRAADRKRPAPTWGWWPRPAWLLSAACATAVTMLAVTGGLAHQRADAVAKQQLFASIGLNQLDNFPAGSLTAGYLGLQ
ncbi:MAG: anti-sigma factor [Verrucomicrobia bacterium]|nr:anti-sigma factor [Verrucomicrobiota bacterium]